MASGESTDDEMIGKPFPPQIQSAAPGHRNRAWRIVAAALLTVGGALGLLLFVQWFEVYFTIWETPVVSEADGTRYLWTAGTALVLLAAAIVLAAIRRERRRGILGGVLLVVTVLFAILFQVPEDRWLPEPANPVPDNTEYLPCFGEGDPNCLGG
jgi:hypothetical protein